MVLVMVNQPSWLNRWFSTGLIASFIVQYIAASYLWLINIMALRIVNYLEDGFSRNEALNVYRGNWWIRLQS